jgi:acylphosphatase
VTRPADPSDADPSGTDPGSIAVEVRITGRVQGVWFRGWTRREARALGLAGWVRNEPDGSVRALFIGPSPAVEAMLGRCYDGPPLARVDAVSAAPVDPVPDLTDFRAER